MKSIQTSITYPSCPFCGGSTTSSSKRSPKRKVALCQLTLYTNSSESFIVWFKKPDEPKGMLWMRSCCIRKGQENSIELISRGCRGRCSYTLKFTNSFVSEEWYRLLKQESRKVPSIGDELPSSADDDDLTSLDTILSEITPLSSLSSLQYSESDENSDEIADFFEPLSAPASLSSIQGKKSKSKSKKKTKSIKPKIKSSPVLCNPLQALGKHRKPINNACSATTMATIFPLESIENTADDQLSRWSWPLKA